MREVDDDEMLDDEDGIEEGYQLEDSYDHADNMDELAKYVKFDYDIDNIDTSLSLDINLFNTPIKMGRLKAVKKKLKTPGYDSQARRNIKFLVSFRSKVQKLRISTDNSIGLKSTIVKGKRTKQNIIRGVSPWMYHFSLLCSNTFLLLEGVTEKLLKFHLRMFPVYNEYLQWITGVGVMGAAWIIGEIDIRKADTVSQIRSFMGLAPGMVQGKIIIAKSKYRKSMGPIVSEIVKSNGNKYIEYRSNDMIPRDKKTKGYSCPYNAKLRTAMVGIVGLGLMRNEGQYRDIYINTKFRMKNQTNTVTGNTDWGKETKQHRHNGAMRKMLSHFCTDLYVNWRSIDVLPVTKSYEETYLAGGHGTHGGQIQKVEDIPA